MNHPTLTPGERYDRHCRQSGYRDDPAQRHALYALNALWHALRDAPSLEKRRRLPGWLRGF